MLYLSTIPKLFLRSLAALNLFCAPNWKLESFSWFTCTYLDGAKNVLIIFLPLKKTFIQKHCRSYFFNVMIHIVITNCCQMNNLENNQWPKAKVPVKIFCLISLVSHQKSYLVCDELSKFWILRNIYLFSSSCLCPLLDVSVLYLEK